MTTVAVVYHSGYGHTKATAESVQKGVTSVADTNAPLINVTEIAANHWDTLASADAIIFGAPTYMGSASAGMKAFMDATSSVWFTQAWKNKLAAGFTVSAAHSGDKLSTLQQLATFAAQHGMLWVPLGIMPGNNHSKGSINDMNRIGANSGLMVQANSDQGTEGIASSDFQTAEAFGANVAHAAKRWATGTVA